MYIRLISDWKKLYIQAFKIQQQLVLIINRKKLNIKYDFIGC